MLHAQCVTATLEFSSEEKCEEFLRGCCIRDTLTEAGKTEIEHIKNITEAIS